jgi:Protein of unknown function (DUF2442)
MQFPKIKSVTTIEKYILRIVFADGTEGDYDISHLSGKGVFKAWDTDKMFYKVFINPESGAISWPGELDVDTINIYCAIKGISVDSYLTKEHHAAH